MIVPLEPKRRVPLTKTYIEPGDAPGTRALGTAASRELVDISLGDQRVWV
jgi:hypothetical protein